MEKKKILIFGYHDISRDPRPLRQIQWLRDRYDVRAVSQTFDESLGVPFIKYPAQPYFRKKLRLLWLILRQYRAYTWHPGHKALAETLGKHKFDLIIVHHLNLLPIAFRAAGDAKVILDAHEFYTEIYDDSALWRVLMKPYFLWLAREFLPPCDLVIGVNESMQRFYEDRYGVQSSYITNAADYHELEPTPVNPEHIRIVHHGLASRSRRLEAMIDVMRHVDKRFTLTFLLLKLNILGQFYERQLRRRARDLPNIEFREPVAGRDVVTHGNAYDIGLFFMPPTNFNEEYSLANKVFQYVQSRLMLAVSPLPEMRKFVDGNGVGIVSDDHAAASLARQLNELTPEQIAGFKAQSHRKARGLSSESNRLKLLDLIAGVLGRPARSAAPANTP